MYEKQLVGRNGEKLACKYLVEKNYKIIERNFKAKHGEIDIIAYDNENNELVFIEVKTRTNYNYGVPSEAIDKSKINHIKSTIKCYLYIKNIENTYIRIDVIEIIFNNGKHRINHIIGAV